MSHYTFAQLIWVITCSTTYIIACSNTSYYIIFESRLSFKWSEIYDSWTLNDVYESRLYDINQTSTKYIILLQRVIQSAMTHDSWIMKRVTCMFRHLHATQIVTNLIHYRSWLILWIASVIRCHRTSTFCSIDLFFYQISTWKFIAKNNLIKRKIVSLVWGEQKNPMTYDTDLNIFYIRNETSFKFPFYAQRVFSLFLIRIEQKYVLLITQYWTYWNFKIEFLQKKKRRNAFSLNVEWFEI